MSQHSNKYVVGENDTRPWGRWEVLSAGDGFITKMITVNPDQKLSLQWHHHRGEHWIITEGEGVVTLGDEDIPVKKGSTIFIPKTVHHRMTNPHAKVLKFVEIQVGSILDESDIERIEDVYGRVN